MRDGESVGQGTGDLHELGLAQRAAVAGVIGKTRLLEFVRLNHVMAFGQAEFAAQGAGIVGLGTRHGDRYAGHRVGAVAEFIGGDFE